MRIILSRKAELNADDLYNDLKLQKMQGSNLINKLPTE